MILCAYPRGFRREYGKEALTLFGERVRAASSRGRSQQLAAVVGGLADAIAGLVLEHLAQRDRRPSARRGRPVRGALHDARLAWRGLRSSPWLAITIVAILGIGTGANLAVFTLVNGLLLRPLPFVESHRLVDLTQTGDDNRPLGVSGPYMAEWRMVSRAFEDFALYDDSVTTLRLDDRNERIAGAEASAELFRTLGIPLAAGRSFTSEENRPGGPPVVVVSDLLRARVFGERSSVLGEVVTLGDVPHLIVGVTPPGFGFPEGALYWTPLGAEPGFEQRDYYDARAVARLADGSDLEDARREAADFAGRLAERFPAEKIGIGAVVRPLRDVFVAEREAQLALSLQAAIMLVLTLVVVSAGSLQSARWLARRGEIAVHLALGAAPSRVTRQLFTEAVLLSAAASVVGAAATVVVRRSFLASIESRLWPGLSFGVDTRVAIGLLACGILTAGLLAAGPVLTTRRSTRTGTLASGLRASDDRSRFGDVLVVLGAAVAVAVLAGALVAFAGFRRLGAIDLGFSPDSITSLSYSLVDSAFDERAARWQLATELLERARGVRGIAAAAGVARMPIGASQLEVVVRPEGVAFEDDEALAVAGFNAITPGYFRVMGTPLLAGRDFSTDDGTGTRVAIVSQSFADLQWPGEDPLGRSLRISSPGSRGRVPDDAEPLQVIGVAPDLRAAEITTPAQASIYVPYAQWPSWYLTVVARHSQDSPTPAELRRILAEIAPGAVVTQARPLLEIVADQRWPARTAAKLMAGFATFAVALAGIGVYGTVAAGVGRRRREIGVRMALGSGKGRVAAWVLRRILLPTLTGTVAGAAGGWILGRFLDSITAGLPAEPGTIETLAAIAGCAGALTALVAAALPARAATRIDPIEALRS